MNNPRAYTTRFARQQHAAIPGTAPTLTTTTQKFNIRAQTTRAPFDMVGNRMVQGEVTQTMSVHGALPDHRQQQARMSKNRGGTTMGVLSNSSLINIEEDDLVFAPRGVRTADGSLVKANQPHAFSSFTGFVLSPEYYPTQEALESAFALVGRSKIPYHWNNPDQRKDGISVQVSGACTVRNHGVESFAFGDTVAWYVYNINDAVRENQVMTVRKARGESVDKFSALLRRVSYRDACRLTQSALNRYAQADPSTASKYLSETYDSQLPVKGEFDSIRRHFQSHCVRNTTTDLLVGIATLQQYGIITFNKNIDDIAAKLNDPIEKMTHHYIDGKGVKLDDEFTLREQWSNVVLLSKILGVIEDRAKKVQPSEHLINALIRRRFRGLLDSEHSKKLRTGASILEAGPEELLEKVTKMATIGSDEHRLSHRQNNAIRESDMEFYAAYRHATKQTIGVCLSATSIAGEDIDLLL
jgi:hypothetical protein